jgi:hypothetical protein
MLLHAPIYGETLGRSIPFPSPDFFDDCVRVSGPDEGLGVVVDFGRLSGRHLRYVPEYKGGSRVAISPPSGSLFAGSGRSRDASRRGARPFEGRPGASRLFVTSPCSASISISRPPASRWARSICGSPRSRTCRNRTMTQPMLCPNHTPGRRLARSGIYGTSIVTGCCAVVSWIPSTAKPETGFVRESRVRNGLAAGGESPLRTRL